MQDPQSVQIHKGAHFLGVTALPPSEGGAGAGERIVTLIFAVADDAFPVRMDGWLIVKNAWVTIIIK